MKTPYIEISKSEELTRILLIEDLLFSEDQKDLFDNYTNFWHLTNSFLNSLEHYFKFKSISSLKECIDTKKEIDKTFKKNVTPFVTSLYNKLIENPDYDFKSEVYDSSDLPRPELKLGFADRVKVAALDNTNSNSINVNSAPTKPGRGQKYCKNKNCKMVIGARSLTCKYCGE